MSSKNAKEAAIIQGMEIIPVKNLNEIIQYLNGERKIEKEETKNWALGGNHKNYEYKFDFSEVKGQENVKRALEISAAGGHNCLLIRKPRFRKNNVSKKITRNFT